VECTKGEVPWGDAIARCWSLAGRLHLMEAAWAAAGVTAEGAGVALSPRQAALRAAALEAGAVLFGPPGVASERGATLIDAMLEASAPFMSDEGEAA
jgi:hypothetical protein